MSPCTTHAISTVIYQTNMASGRRNKHSYNTLLFWKGNLSEMVGNSKGERNHVSRTLLVRYNSLLSFIQFSTLVRALLENFLKPPAAAAVKGSKGISVTSAFPAHPQCNKGGRMNLSLLRPFIFTNSFHLLSASA